MPSSKKSKLLKALLTAANASCGCGRPKQSQVHEPTPALPKSKTTIPQKDPNSCSSSNSHIGKSDNEESCTSMATTANSTFSIHNLVSDESNPQGSNKITNSIAVVKNSNDPYQDFRHSMLQMIFEKEIYAQEDLQELLNCFLELNPSCHHGLIIQAFTEIWNEIISK